MEAIKIIEKLIDEDKINGKEATVLYRKIFSKEPTGNLTYIRSTEDDDLTTGNMNYTITYKT